jgi:hypothetical protein
MVILLGITVDSLREVNMEVAKHEREGKGVAALHIFFKEKVNMALHTFSKKK